ncbi:MAG TPA: SDR family NAD(P)-dependent oxidoreductase [Tepidiformaceae bacterium]|nr:SDR family NAD(P)-dependent oxidoreductase [Tepidiformaceae bacterium]
MRDLAGRTAIVTGASRGLGPYLARGLAREGVNLVLAARNEVQLAEVATKLDKTGVRTLTIPCDVSRETDRERLVARALEEFGQIDILVNNAGIEVVQAYEELPPFEIERVIEVNLLAPMLLAHAVLPHMLERRTGFIVNMASLAGKTGPAHSETYSASKAGLILFTESLRHDYRKRGVSATALCPGFVSDAGMYADMQARAGVKANRLLGESTPAKVVAAMLRAIKKDQPEMIVNPGPMRLNLALRQLAPGLFERIVPLFGANKMFDTVAEQRTSTDPADAAEPIETH